MSIDLNQRVHIIYPDDRFVPVKRLIQWACDAVSNGDTQAIDPPTTFAEVIDILNDSGYVTFHKDVEQLFNLFREETI